MKQTSAQASKTRLAVQVAASLLEAFPHGAWFVSLAEVADPELRECLDVALELGDLAGVALDLDRLGQAAWPSGSPNERSSWPRPPTDFVSPSAVDSRRSQAGGRPSIHEMPPDGSSPTPRSTAWAQGRTMGLEDAVAYVRIA